MTENSAPPPSSRGLLGELQSLWHSVGCHLQALGELAGYEGREAGALYLRLAVVLVAALLCLLFGYVLLLVFLAFLVSAMFCVSWLWITLVLGILHLLAGTLGALHMKRRLRTPLFASTRAILQSDLDALKPPPRA